MRVAGPARSGYGAGDGIRTRTPSRAADSKSQHECPGLSAGALRVHGWCFPMSHQSMFIRAGLPRLLHGLLHRACSSGSLPTAVCARLLAFRAAVAFVSAAGIGLPAAPLAHRHRPPSPRHLLGELEVYGDDLAVREVTNHALTLALHHFDVYAAPHPGV